jgi:hypothetical protein
MRASVRVRGSSSGSGLTDRHLHLLARRPLLGAPFSNAIHMEVVATDSAESERLFGCCFAHGHAVKANHAIVTVVAQWFSLGNFQILGLLLLLRVETIGVASSCHTRVFIPHHQGRQDSDTAAHRCKHGVKLRFQKCLLVDKRRTLRKFEDLEEHKQDVFANVST